MIATPGSIAVVIPTKNGARYIGEALRSALDQSRPPDEIVVVDDGSTDETAHIVAGHASVRLLSNRGSGGNAARATGIDATTSDYVALLDHDDLWFPHHLETLAGLLDRSPHAVAFSRLNSFAGTVEPKPAAEAPTEEIDMWERFPFNSAGAPTFVVVRRSALEQIGGWPTWNRSPTDTYVWFRLGDVGPFLWWRGDTAAWRRHEASQTFALYRSDFFAYQRSTLDLLRDALAVHLTLKPEDAGRLTKRLDQLDALVEILAVMCNGDLDSLPLALQGRTCDNRDLDEPVVEMARALLGSVIRRPSTRPSFWRSYMAWPREYRAARRRAIDPILARAIVTAISRDPRRPSHWRLPLERGHRRALVPLSEAVVRVGWQRRRSS